MRILKEMPTAAEQISSPYDPDARYSTKRDGAWVGYKVHLTEASDPDTPHVITNVETTPATTPDDNMVSIVHASLEQSELLPTEPLVDKDYTGSHVLVESQRGQGVTVVGPVAADPSWQARSGDGSTKAQFQVDWDRQKVTCPKGKKSISWLPNTYPQNGMQYEARFARTDCTPCAMRSRCTRGNIEPRIIGLQAREKYEAVQSARRRQMTKDFQGNTPHAPALKAHTHRQSVVAAYADVDISAWLKLACSTSS